MYSICTVLLEVVMCNFPCGGKTKLLVLHLIDIDKGIHWHVAPCAAQSCLQLNFTTSKKKKIISEQRENWLCITSCKIHGRWDVLICFWEFCVSGKPISTSTVYQCTWLNTELNTCAFDICQRKNARWIH